MADAATVHPTSEDPPWLVRVSEAGSAVTTAANLQDLAGIVVSAKRIPDAELIAQCMAIERKLFAKHEAMDISHEVNRVSGVRELHRQCARVHITVEYGIVFRESARLPHRVRHRMKSADMHRRRVRHRPTSGLDLGLVPLPHCGQHLV